MNGFFSTWDFSPLEIRKGKEPSEAKFSMTFWLPGVYIICPQGSYGFSKKIGNKKTSLRFHQLIGVIFTRKLSKDSTTNIANATAASVMMLQSRGEPQKMVRESTFKGGQTL